MGLITLNLKRVLNWNFIFMSAVAAIFGMISLMNFGDISENIVCPRFYDSLVYSRTLLL